MDPVDKEIVLIKKIEKIRNELKNLIMNEDSLSKDEVVKKSMQLDQLINNYNKIKKEGREYKAQ